MAPSVNDDRGLDEAGNLDHKRAKFLK